MGAIQQLASEWERCKPWIEAALEYSHGTHTIDDIEMGILTNHFLFWPGKECAAVTEFITYPRMKVLNFFLLGGNLEELLTTLEPRICEFAKKSGCARVIGAGREGFKKVLKPHGYEPIWQACAKDLT